MAQLVAEAKANPHREPSCPLVPGQRNRRDEIATPNGVRIDLIADTITPEQARREVASGALVVLGDCGCGPTDCGELSWPAPPKAIPVPGEGWLALWEGQGVRVVFGHALTAWHSQ